MYTVSMITFSHLPLLFNLTSFSWKPKHNIYSQAWASLEDRRRFARHCASKTTLYIHFLNAAVVSREVLSGLFLFSNIIYPRLHYAICLSFIKTTQSDLKVMWLLHLAGATIIDIHTMLIMSSFSWNNVPQIILTNASLFKMVGCVLRQL